MKSIYGVFLFVLLIWACSSTPREFSKQTNTITETTNDTIRIANEELEYEIIIIDPGFNPWLNSYAMPRGHYNQSFLESRNRIWVIEFNQRVLQPYRYDTNLYLMSIDYRSNIDYGYEVNYMLYNYLVYFQMTNKQNFGTFTARP
jgi:hypothetical protein